jgi:hypothetical protein
MNNFKLGFERFFLFVLVFFFRAGIIFYAKYIYQQGDTGFMNTDGKLTLGYRLIVFFIYLLILGSNVKMLNSNEIKQNKKDVFAVEHRMFLIIKLKPKMMKLKVVLFNN